MDVEKTLADIKKKYDKAKKKDKIVLHKFKRKDFKDDLSVSNGFGHQDLKDEPRQLYRKLLCEYDDLQMHPTGTSKATFGVEISILV